MRKTSAKIKFYVCNRTQSKQNKTEGGESWTELKIGVGPKTKSGCQTPSFRCNMRPGERETKMRHIDIDSLSEEELIELNHKVVARLRFLHQMRSHSAMLGFRIGEKVKFHPDGGAVVFGTLTRYNKKTVTVVTDAGENWNVAPGLLSKVEFPATRKTKPEDAGVVPFPERATEK
jgi:hypothetical protein